MTDSEVDLRYHIIRRDGDFEIRDYHPQLIAEVVTLGSRKKAISKGFRMLFDYISGQNGGKQKIEMTAPVLQERTAAQNEWKVRFLMPARMVGGKTYHPNNAKIHLLNVPAHRVAAIHFSGLAGDASLARHENLLNSWLEKNHIGATGHPMYAFYNAPWTLPFFRRNEIMKEVNLKG